MKTLKRLLLPDIQEFDIKKPIETLEWCGNWTPEGCTIGMIIQGLKHVSKKMHARYFWFRGQGNSSQPLRPKVHRPAMNSFGEMQLVRHFRREAPSRFRFCPPMNDHVAWLCLMQHYGLPTRLLDRTESLIIAAHFAVREKAVRGRDGGGDEEAVIWALDPGGLNGAMTGKCFFPLLFTQDAVNLRSPDIPNGGFMAPLVEQVFGEGIELEQEPIPALALMPGECDPRMMLQRSMFTIHRDSDPLESLKYGGNYLLKIPLPPPVVATLKEELDSLAIRDSTLFPDLDHLSADLARASFMQQPTTEPPCESR